uniref:Uncharacterized protein n=1 Tax=Zea mays TaxID=4577 RepID=A0A804U9X6_MAIZE
MGQCSSSQHPEAEQQKQQQAAACVDIQKRFLQTTVFLAYIYSRRATQTMHGG